MQQRTEKVSRHFHANSGGEVPFKVFDAKTALKTAVYRTGSGVEKPPQLW
jgi:hypothetical protein